MELSSVSKNVQASSGAAPRPCAALRRLSPAETPSLGYRRAEANLLHSRTAGSGQTWTYEWPAPINQAALQEVTFLRTTLAQKLLPCPLCSSPLLTPSSSLTPDNRKSTGGKRGTADSSSPATTTRPLSFVSQMS